ncbi:hypothetical protein FWF89_02750 [Candidatus Saccharibacteria bacterium]|nr:hypothetical protein [Candidatus Saccharibacteria bacterium]
MDNTNDLSSSQTGEGKAIKNTPDIPMQTTDLNPKGNVIYGSNETKKKKLLIAIAVVAVLILGLGGFFLYNLIFDTSDEAQEDETPLLEDADKEDGTKKDDGGNADSEQTEDSDTVHLDINSSTVSSLIYPAGNYHNGLAISWNYKSVSVKTMGRRFMMESAARIDGLMEKSYESANEYGTGYYVSAMELEKNFKKVFGPDTEYKNGDVVAGDSCFGLSGYVSSKNAYFVPTACGGDRSWRWYNQTRLYKAEQKGDEVYTYFYVQPYINDYCAPDDYLYKREKDNDKDYLGEANSANNWCPAPKNYLKKIASDKVESTINAMMDRAEVDTYKFTFKKQSDGKYYFYSGVWK